MAARDGVPRIVAGGGDGSADEAANGLMALPAADRPALPENCPCLVRGA